MRAGGAYRVDRRYLMQVLPVHYSECSFNTKVLSNATINLITSMTQLHTTERMTDCWSKSDFFNAVTGYDR